MHARYSLHDELTSVFFVTTDKKHEKDDRAIGATPEDPATDTSCCPAGNNGDAIHTKALKPVIALPTISAFISRVPS